MRALIRWGVPALVLVACAQGEAHAPREQDLDPAWKALASERPAARPTAGARVIGRPGSPTAVLGDVAGWDAEAIRPTNRTTAIACAPDGRVALAWLHNGGPDGPPDGEPTTYATLGDPDHPGSFTAPVALARRPFRPGFGVLSHVRKYNGAHNAPFVLPMAGGGFLGLAVPMNANGYAQGRSPTGYAYAAATVGARSTTWSPPSLVPLGATQNGSSLSEMSGGMGPDGTIHLLGQGHLGRFQGGLGYQGWKIGQAVRSVNLASAYRPAGKHYFVEGAMAIAPNGELHVAFAWNKQGAVPMYGLYYLVSRDGGHTWRTAQGRPVTPPLQAGASAEAAAVVPARLGRVAYGGAREGVHSLSIAVAPDGKPVIVRSEYLVGDRTRTQAVAFAFTGRLWASVKVGPPRFWNQGGTGVAVNPRTGRVNVLLLDPGSVKRPGQVVRYDQPLKALREGKAWWRRQVVGEAPNTRNYASSLKVAEVPGQKLVFVFEPSYRNPGRVSPVLGQAELK